MKKKGNTVHSVTIQLEADDVPFSVVVEPWAAPLFEVAPHERCAVVVENPAVEPTVTCGVIRGVMYVNVYESGSTFKFLRNGTVESEMPVAIPGP
jgi:hypothetical protein